MNNQGPPSSPSMDPNLQQISSNPIFAVNLNSPFLPHNLSTSTNLDAGSSNPNFRFRSIKANQQKSLTQANPLSPCMKPMKEKTVTLAQVPRTCSECGREFPSARALYGHMRSHPERKWRGINPPANKSRSMESVLEEMSKLPEYEIETEVAKNIKLLSKDLNQEAEGKSSSSRFKKEKKTNKKRKMDEGVLVILDD